MGKLYVDRQIAWSREQDIDFINPALGIRMPLLRGLVFVDYPGWEGGTWTAMAERDWYKRGGCLRCEVSSADENGHSRVLSFIQWHDTPDESGFGMENTPEIVLYSTLDERGRFMHPFRLQIRLVSRARLSRRRAYGCVAEYEKRAAEVLSPLRRADYGCLSQLRLRLRDAS